MEEMEAPLEQAQEDIHHHAHHSPERWVGWVALSSAFLAALAAVAVLLAGHHVNEGQIKQIQCSDKWAEYQAKKLKSLIIESKDEQLRKAGAEVGDEDVKYLKRHEDQEKDLRTEAEHLQREAADHIERHTPLAVAVTMFQVAIAVSAISVLSKRPPFWYVSLAFGLIGLVALAYGLLKP